MSKPKRKPAPAKRPELSRLELAVMDVVWQLGECSSAEVIAEFQKRRRLAPTTIRTVLANLRKKKYLEPVPTIERGFRLKATVGRFAIARRTLREILGSLFQGSLQQAIACLLSDEQLTDEEMRELRQLIGSRTKKAGGRQPAAGGASDT